MSLTQFAMVEELASLVKDNIPCKHLILSMEHALVNFLQDHTSLDGVLELKPMNPYNRLLVHCLADIFGFSHQSVGEREDRHIILECCPETSMPAILVSDFLSQYDEMEPPMIFEVLRRKEVIPGQRENAVSLSSLEERETSYFAARERIFSADASETKLIKQRPKNDPAVARRMITHALRQTNKVMKHELSLSDTKECGQAANDVKKQLDSGNINSSNEMELKSISPKHLRQCATSKVHKFSGEKLTNSMSEGPQQNNDLKLAKGGAAAEPQENDTKENHLRKEHMGAAKRLFANALGMHRRDGNPSKCNQTKEKERYKSFKMSPTLLVQKERYSSFKMSPTKSVLSVPEERTRKVLTIAAAIFLKKLAIFAAYLMVDLSQIRTGSTAIFEVEREHSRRIKTINRPYICMSPSSWTVSFPEVFTID